MCSCFPEISWPLHPASRTLTQHEYEWQLPQQAIQQGQVQPSQHGGHQGTKQSALDQLFQNLHGGDLQEN